MGVSGCGKSIAIKAIASSLKLPLIARMTESFPAITGRRMGFARACHTHGRDCPAVVWLTNRMGIMQRNSSGEQGRILRFLTWMQEKVRGLFVAATANRIDLLPAEMIRKGRFDEVFFVDLPTDEERIEIFEIHLNDGGSTRPIFGLERLTRLTKAGPVPRLNNAWCPP